MRVITERVMERLRGKFGARASLHPKVEADDAGIIVDAVFSVDDSRFLIRRSGDRI